MASVTCVVCGAEVTGFLCEVCRAPRPKAPTGRRHRASADRATPSPPLDPAPAGERSDAPYDVDASRSDLTRIEAPPVSSTGAVAVCDHLGNPPGRLICERCNMAIPAGRAEGASPASFAIELPWGRHVLGPGDELEIGREVGPHRSQVDRFTTVSRRHARLRATERGLYVQDFESTNKTYVNGVAIDPWMDVELSAGDRVELSTRLTITIGTAEEWA